MSAQTDKFGNAPKKTDAPRATPGVLKIAIKSCSGLQNNTATGRCDAFCIMYNPSGIEVIRTSVAENTTNPEFLVAQSKANMMFHNEHGHVRIEVKDKDPGRVDGLGVVFIPVRELLSRENGVMTAPLASSSDEPSAFFDPIRDVKGEASVKSGYVTFQYQYSAGGSCSEPAGTKPAEPTAKSAAGESNSKDKKDEKERSKKPDLKTDSKKKDKDAKGAPSATLVLADLKEEMASLPPVSSKPVQIPESLTSVVPLLAEAEVYFADKIQFAADPVNARNNKVACVLFVTRTHLYLVDASSNSTALRCIPVSDVTSVLSKGEKICVKCKAQHDFYGELSSADSAKGLGSTLTSLAASVGGAVSTGDLKELKSHQWSPRDGYTLAVFPIHSSGSSSTAQAVEPAKSSADETAEKLPSNAEMGEKVSKKVSVEKPLEAPASSSVADTQPSAGEHKTSESKTAPKVPTSRVASAPMTIRERFERFCSRYIPDRLPSLDTILGQYKGREEELMAELVKAHGPEPDDEGPAAIDKSRPFLARITRFFAKYQPSRMVEAPYLARQYSTREEELMTGLVFVYGPEPPASSAEGAALSTSVILGKLYASGSGSERVEGAPVDSIEAIGRLPPLVRLEFPFTQPAPPGSEHEYARPQQGVSAMMPSLNFAAVLWSGHVAYHSYSANAKDLSAPTIRVMVAILTRSHLYIGSDFHYERCIPIRLIERFYLRAKLRTNSTHIRVATVVKVKAPEPDCYFEFSEQHEGERMISLVMRLALVANPHHVIDTAPFESALEPHFSLVLPEGYSPRRVEPLPLLPEYENTMGRYRSRLISIYERGALDKMEDVDRILYMFPHEEERMVQKLRGLYAGAGGDEGHLGDGDASDIMGLATLRHNNLQSAAAAGFALKSNPLARHAPPFLDAAVSETTPQGFSFLEPAPTAISYGGSPNSRAPAVGRYTVGTPTSPHPSAMLGTTLHRRNDTARHDVVNSATATRATVGGNQTSSNSYSTTGYMGSSRNKQNHLHIEASGSTGANLKTVADLLKTHGFSVLSFNRAAREGRAYATITASCVDESILRDIQYKLAQCGEDEELFLDMIRGGPPLARSNLQQQSSFSGIGVRGGRLWAYPAEAIESSSHNGAFSPSPMSHNATQGGAAGHAGGVNSSQTSRSLGNGAASAPSVQLTRQHPLWPYL